MKKPTAGELEQRTAPEEGTELRVEGKRLRGRIPYGVESRDLGGWREVMAPGSLSKAGMDDLVATLNHNVDRVLGRHPGTLEVEDRDDGLHWSVELPDSPTGHDVRAAVERGDLKAGSWRMIVGRDRWDGNVRHVEEVRELRDVAVVAHAAYGDAAPAELRSHEQHEEVRETEKPNHEEDAVKPGESKSRSRGLRVEDRQQAAGEDRTVEARVWDAMRGVPQGEARDLTRATTDPVQPDDVRTMVWDRLRDAAVVLATGVPVFTTDRGKVTWPVITDDIEADFYDELETITASDPGLDDFELEPKAIKALVRGSSEALEDSDPSLLQVVTDNLHVSLGLKVDREFLVGNAAKGFKGLSQMPGTQVLDMEGAGFTDYDPLIVAVGLLMDAGVPGPYACVAHPRILTQLDLLRENDTDSLQPLARPEGLPPMWTTRALGVTAGEDPTSTVLVYAPRQLAVVRRRDVTIEVDRSREFEDDAVLVRGKLRATIGTPHPQAVVKLTNVAAPAPALAVGTP